MGCCKVFAKAISQLLRRWYSLSNRKCFFSNYPVPLASSRHFLNNRLERIITDLYTYPEMAKRIFFLAKQIQPLLPTMSDSLFAWRGGGGGALESGLYTINVFVLTACTAEWQLLLTKFAPVTPFKNTN